MSGLWDWSPGESVGPFRFGEPAADLIELYDMPKQPLACPMAYWETYKMPGWDSFITVKDGIVSNVSCWDSCLLDGNELLGMPFTLARDILGPEDGLGEGLGYGFAAYYPRLGLTLWVEESGIIESATCAAPDEDD